jgi:Ca2+-binding EF-hand superfamily protein
LDATELMGALGPGQMKQADPDKDGTLDVAEYLAVVETRFKEADTDHDGTLSVQELETPRGQALRKLLQY